MSSDRMARFEERLRAHQARVLLALALDFQGQAKADYSVPNPAPHANPAPRGAFPRGRTFGGRDNISISPTSLAEIAATGEVRVGIRTGGKHLVFLARKGWKGLKDSYLKARPRLARLRKFLGG